MFSKIVEIFVALVVALSGAFLGSGLLHLILHDGWSLADTLRRDGRGMNKVIAGLRQDLAELAQRQMGLTVVKIGSHSGNGQSHRSVG